MCSTIPNLCPTSSLIFQPVGENSFEEKSWTGLGGSTLNVDPVPRFTPKNMTRIFPPLTHPHFIYSPAGRLVSIQHRRSINFEFFIRRSPAQPRFFRPDLTPFLSRGRARKGRSVSRHRSRFLFPAVLSWKRLNCSSRIRVEETERERECIKFRRTFYFSDEKNFDFIDTRGKLWRSILIVQFGISFFFFL